MATDNLPYEIKRMIFDHLNLPIIKVLRLVSKSWSTVGIEFLFTASYHVRSFTKDILRLIEISQSPNVSHQFAKSTKEITFQITDWLPEKLHDEIGRRYSTSRFLALIGYNGHVTTVEGRGAYEELYAVVAEQAEFKAKWFDEKRLLLGTALKAVPLVNSIKITSPNALKFKTSSKQPPEQGSRLLISNTIVYLQIFSHQLLSTQSPPTSTTSTPSV
ncbi:hypothetical protein HYFRA_00013012 [Hymenoscyphus fraxineus]|uniref:F-box domain-containing protein n=1 Tax=Hymenoscyphus fraxineus TaxID=746836 RepID=A0A9N9PM35_9HELO|nr:hypothetical protein HYFRA_00013012 [Hymenoscyphus fraxineus]